jgi:uncharacterized caspase-like protein
MRLRRARTNRRSDQTNIQRLPAAESLVMAGRIGIVSRLIFAAFLVCAGGCSVAHAEKRVALVIGNSAYRAVPALANPTADARLISDTLLSLGFFVVGGGAQLDLDKSGFDDALREFGKQLIGADVALFYYAGHGVESHGLNFLVPVDAHPEDESDVFAQSIGISGILAQMEKSGTRINLLLLDACRDNPFRDRGVRSATGGLAQMQAPLGTLISFATQPRSVSLDGDDGHSPYTRALAATMQRPGFGLFKTFNEVGLAVEKATRGRQLPWVSSSPISGNFYFAGKPAQALTPPDASAPLVQEAVSRHRTIPCATISSPTATGWRRCPTIAGMRLVSRASTSTRSMSRRQRRPATTRSRVIRK